MNKKKSVKMRIVIEDPDKVLRELLGLYKELPVELRTVKPRITASELIFEAAEFISMLKNALHLRGKDVSEPLYNPWISGLKSKVMKKTRSVQTSMTLSAKAHIGQPVLQNIPIPPPPLPPQLPLPPDIPPPTLPPLQPATPTMPVIKVEPQGMFHNQPPQHLAPHLPPSGSSVLKKQITIMAKDKVTGITKPVTFFPAFGKGGSTGMPTIRLANGQQSKVQFVSLSTPIAKPMSIQSAPKPIVLTPLVQQQTVRKLVHTGPNPSNRTPMVRVPTPGMRVTVPKRTDDMHLSPARPPDNHGIICKKGCTCALSRDGIPVSMKYKAQLLTYLRKCLKIKPRDAETMLTYNWIQDEIFQILFSHMNRATFFKFCRVVSFTMTNCYAGERKECVLVVKSDNMLNGMTAVKGKIYCVPLIMVKMFRDGYGDHPVSTLTVESMKDCKMSKRGSCKESEMCINPYHYGYEEPITEYDGLTDLHNCPDTSRVRAANNGLTVVCTVCHSTLSTVAGVLRNAAPNLAAAADDDDDGETEYVAVANPQPTDIIVKQEKVDSATTKSLDDLENDFEGMLQSVSDQVEVESGSAGIIQVMKKASGVKRTYGKNDDDAVDEEQEVVVKKKKKRPDGFQCWQCLHWYKTKDELTVHSCMQKLQMDSEIAFVCQYCGCCNEDIKWVRKHVEKCRNYGLAALVCLRAYENAAMSKYVEKRRASTSSSSEAAEPDSGKRPERGAKKTENAKCDECGVTFASNHELVLHNTKLKCKSIQCGECLQFFASARTHANHPCNGVEASEKDRMAHIATIDQEIVVIQMDKNKVSLQPVKCKDCNNLIQCYTLLREHQSSPTFCGICRQPFANTCKLLRHECPGEPKKTHKTYRPHGLDKTPIVRIVDIMRTSSSNSASIAVEDEEDIEENRPLKMKLRVVNNKASVIKDIIDVEDD